MSVYPKAAPDSLPHCLLHGDRNDALAHAVALVSFLQVSIEGFHRLDSTIPREALEGMGYCFDLLRDKIEIGGGAYLFPFFDHAADAPQLCFREDL